MNLDIIFDGFILLCGLEYTEATKWLPLCKSAMEEIKSRLCTGVNTDANAVLLNNCASCGAFLKYSVIMAAHPESEAFSAGDVKITKKSSGSLVGSAQILYNQALKSAAHLFANTGFAFKEISTDD